MKPSLIILICSLFFISNKVLCQVSYGGYPLSISNSNKGLVKSDLLTGNYNLPTLDNKRVIKNLPDDQSRDAYYGKLINTEFDFFSKAKLNVLSNGKKIWLLEVNSLTAYGMQFYFKKFNLIQGSELYLYNSTHDMILGAFTNKNNPVKGKGRYDFLTQWIEGRKIIIEYIEPENQINRSQIVLGKTLHIFKDVFDRDGPYTVEPGIGDCYNNVACNQDESKTKAISSVGLVLALNEELQYSALCSGALINNTEKDGKPYFLTAAHCFYNTSESFSVFNDWIFIFNHQVDQCSDNGDEVQISDNSVRGASIRAIDLPDPVKSDHLLLELDVAESKLAEYKVNYAGWNRSLSGGGTNYTYSVHHPMGSVKKISVDDDPPSYSNDLYSYWQVFWDSGVTAAGSSGSPLFNADHQIIGQLKGGRSTCENIELADFYGQMSVSWQKDIGLKLDPSNSGVMSIGSYTPTGTGDPFPPDDGCSVKENDESEVTLGFVVSAEKGYANPSGYGGQKLFGTSLDYVDGNLVVGAPGEKKVYLYKYDDCQIILDRTFDAGVLNVTRDGEKLLLRDFGYEIALYKNFLAVGTNDGAVIIYKNENDTWKFHQSIVHNRGSGFGFSLGFTKDYLVVGAPWDIASQGTINFFKLSSDKWEFYARFISNYSSSSRFGKFLDVYGNYVIASGRGEVAIYKLDESITSGLKWTRDFVTNDFTSLARNVAIDQNVAIVESGSKVKIINNVSGVWTLSSQIISPDVNTNHFGTLDIKGERLLIGADVGDYDYSDFGSVYIYESYGGVWIEKKKILPQYSVGAYGLSGKILDDFVVVGEPQGGQRGSCQIEFPGRIIIYDNYVLNDQITSQNIVDICDIDKNTSNFYAYHISNDSDCVIDADQSLKIYSYYFNLYSDFDIEYGSSVEINPIDCILFPNEYSNKEKFTGKAIDYESSKPKNITIKEFNQIPSNTKELNRVSVYPNPTATFINVEIADNTKEFTYQVVALDGSVLVNGKASVSERIDISAVETGMYILEITQGQKAFVTRIVKH